MTTGRKPERHKFAYLISRTRDLFELAIISNRSARALFILIISSATQQHSCPRDYRTVKAHLTYGNNFSFKLQIILYLESQVKASLPLREEKALN